MEYLIFTENLAALPEGKEGNLVVKTLEPRKYKYESKYVRATVSSSPGSLPGADTLWVRFYNGDLHPKPYAIKVIAELSGYPG
jgi:hypothetical protein